MGEVQVIREAEDPLALRASIGGGKAAGDGRFYLVYRGDPVEVLAMLEAVIVDARRVLPAQAGGPQG